MGFLNRLQPLGLLALRVVVGMIMTAHGWQKLHGGMTQFVHQVGGMGMPWWLAYFAVAAEFLGGLLLIIGFATRFAAIAICIDMLVAVFKVHLHHGLFAPGGGYEYALTLGTAAFALIFLGAGAISIDWVIGGKSK